MKPFNSIRVNGLLFEVQYHDPDDTDLSGNNVIDADEYNVYSKTGQFLGNLIFIVEKKTNLKIEILVTEFIHLKGRGFTSNDLISETITAKFTPQLEYDYMIKAAKLLDESLENRMWNEIKV